MRPVQHSLLRTLWTAMRTPILPGRRGYLRLGWLLLLLLVAQVISGVLLSFYYQASPELAAESVEYIMRDVRWGWLIRGIHHWASFGIIALAVLQLVRVLVAGTYRGSRRSSWTLGLLLLLGVLGLAVSGDLLPWDNEAYWAADSLAGRLESLPWLGPGLANTLRGGEEVGAATLSRAFSMHVLLLPGLVALVLLLHLWLMARRRGEDTEAGR